MFWKTDYNYLSEVIDACEGAQRQKNWIKQDLKPIVERDGGLDLQVFPPEFRWNLCSARMILGDFSNYDGWEFRSNWSITYQGYNGKQFDVPKWNGRPCKHLVILGEQGIGDEILYSSVIPELIIRLGHDSLEFQCHPRLKPIMERSFRINCTDRRFLSEVEGEASVALSDLMMFYRRDKSHFPRKPFLKPNPDLQEKWKSWLGKFKGPVRGIAWGSRHGVIDPQTLISGPTVSLQYFSEEYDYPPIPKGVLVPDVDPTENMDDHLALVSVLDEVVSVTQTVVHEAGAVGTPCKAIRPPKNTGETNSQLWYYPKGPHPVYGSVDID